MTDDMITHSFAWCVLRNLVHTVYREARHLGPSGDPDAKVTVSDGHLLASAKQCRDARKDLESTSLYNATAKASTVREVLKRYEDKTDLAVDDLITVFNLPGWRRSYGGQKWARITEALKELVLALEAGNLEDADRISKDVYSLQHNSGPLVPSRLDWKQNTGGFTRKKWPQLCD
jgi:hypothetical protein